MRKLVIICAFVCFCGCQNVSMPEKPENLIPQVLMVDIITSSYTMNAARSIDNRTIVNKGIKLDSIIYNRFKIDSLQFAQSNEYYSADLDTYKEIFLQVEAKLSEEREKRELIWDAYREAQKEKQKLDSIKAVALDSLKLKFPSLKQDSLQRILNTLNFEKFSSTSKIKSGIGEKENVSQDSVL